MPNVAYCDDGVLVVRRVDLWLVLAIAKMSNVAYCEDGDLVLRRVDLWLVLAMVSEKSGYLAGSSHGF